MDVSDDSVTIEMDQSTSPSVESEVASLSARSSYTPTAPVNSKKTKTPFFGDYGRLPTSGHPKQAHVLDIERSARCSLAEEGSVQLQDAIATTLSNVSPETLKSFLSPTVNNFKAIFKNNKSDKQLVIWRKGIEVFIGTFTRHTSFKSFGFEHIAGVLIGYDGSWHLKVTAGNAYCSTKWTDVWNGKFTCYGGVNKMTVESEDMWAEKSQRASRLAQTVLEAKYWEGDVDMAGVSRETKL